MKPIVGAVRTLCFVIIGAVPLWATTFNDDVRSALGIAPGTASKITAFVAVLGGVATLIVRSLEDKGKVTSLGRNTTLPPPLPPPH